MLWEAADRVCGKKLKVLIAVLIDAMEPHGHLALDPIIKEKVLASSAATIDRTLAGIRAQIQRPLRPTCCRSRIVGSLTA